MPKEPERLIGLIAAPHTPFSHANELALDVINQQADLLVEQGVTGAFICGTTGEGASLSSEERRAVTERWVSAARGRLKIVAHVGHTALGVAQELAAHAQSAGVWATSSVAPYYFKPANARELTTYCAEVAAAAPSLPFYYYHSPGMTGVALSPTGFLEDAAPRIPNLAGIKFNDGDLYEYQRCLAFDGGRFDIPFGVDEALIGGIAAGAVGAVGSTYNYAAPLYLEMMSAFERGDMATARERSRQSVELVEQLHEFGGVAAGKAFMALHGIDVGATRPPIAPLSEPDRERLLSTAMKLGFVRRDEPRAAVARTQHRTVA